MSSTRVYRCSKRLAETQQCTQCDLQVSSKVMLENHMFLVHRIDDDTKFCREVLGSTPETAKVAALEEINVDIEKAFDKVSVDPLFVLVCALCPYKTKNSEYLLKHVISKHSLQRIKCKQCSYKARNGGDLVEHVQKTHLHKNSMSEETKDEDKEVQEANQRHKNEEERHVGHSRDNKKRGLDWAEFEKPTVQWQCSECMYNSRFHGRLVTHLLVKHRRRGDINWNSCRKCSYKSLYKTNLSRHYFTSHSNLKAKWFVCDRCLFKTMDASRLTKHLKTHMTMLL